MFTVTLGGGAGVGRGGSCRHVTTRKGLRVHDCVCVRFFPHKVFVCLGSLGRHTAGFVFVCQCTRAQAFLFIWVWVFFVVCFFSGRSHDTTSAFIRCTQTVWLSWTFRKLWLFILLFYFILFSSSFNQMKKTVLAYKKWPYEHYNLHLTTLANIVKLMSPPTPPF